MSGNNAVSKFKTGNNAAPKHKNNTILLFMEVRNLLMDKYKKTKNIKIPPVKYITYLVSVKIVNFSFKVPAKKFPKKRNLKTYLTKLEINSPIENFRCVDAP